MKAFTVTQELDLAHTDRVATERGYADPTYRYYGEPTYDNPTLAHEVLALAEEELDEARYYYNNPKGYCSCCYTGRRPAWARKNYTEAYTEYRRALAMVALVAA